MNKENLWNQFSKAERPFRLVDFPRKDADGKPMAQVAMRVMTRAESDECAVAADKATRAQFKDNPPSRDDAKIGYEDFYKSAFCVELLSRVCRWPEDMTPFFPDKSYVGKLTVDECAVLIEEYAIVQADLGPIVAHMSKQEVDALVARLVEEGRHDPLGFLSPDSLRALVISLASRIASLLKDKSSPGSPPEEASE
jgi:hypothetical protein